MRLSYELGNELGPVFLMFANPGLFMSNFAFSQYNNKYSTEFDNKSKAGVLGIQTRDRKVVGTDESAKLWCPPPISPCYHSYCCRQSSALSIVLILWKRKKLIEWRFVLLQTVANKTKQFTGVYVGVWAISNCAKVYK